MITIRPATLADAPAITAIHCSDIVTWKRWDAADVPHLAQYDDLTPYERWLNGGPWMDTGTLIQHLSHIPPDGGLALVAVESGQVRAEAEASLSDEPPPFGRTLNIEVLYTLRGYAGRGLGSALMRALEAAARREYCDTLTVSHAEAAGFYAKHGLNWFQNWQRQRLPARTNQTQYAVESVTDAAYAQVRGWSMPIGRHQSARYEWDHLQSAVQPDFPEWRHLRLVRRRLIVRQQPALIILDESPHEPGIANAHLWLPPNVPLTRQHIAALRNEAAQAGFTALNCFLADTQARALGPDATPTEYHQALWLKHLTSE